MKDYSADGYTLRISPCNSSQAYMGTILETGTEIYCDTVGELFREFEQIVKELKTTNDHNSCQNRTYF